MIFAAAAWPQTSLYRWPVSRDWRGGGPIRVWPAGGRPRATRERLWLIQVVHVCTAVPGGHIGNLGRENSRKWVLGVVGVALVVLLGLQLPILHSYVTSSTDPIDLRNASSATLLPAFRRDFADTHEPIIAVTETPRWENSRRQALACIRSIS